MRFTDVSIFFLVYKILFIYLCVWVCVWVCNLLTSISCKVLKPLGFLPDQFDKFIAFVQESPDFYVDSSNALKQAYEVMCEKIREILPYYFDIFPK